MLDAILLVAFFGMTTGTILVGLYVISNVFSNLTRRRK